MYHLIAEILENAEFVGFNAWVAYAIFAALVIMFCLLLRFILLAVFKRVLAIFLTEDKSHTKTFEKLGWRISNIAITFVAYFFAQEFAAEFAFIGTVANIVLAIHLLLVFFSCVRCFEAVYDSSEVAKNFPIHGIMQIVNVVAGIICVIVIISILADQSPAVLIGSLGAATAIITLVFKDAIVGFVAGIQLISHKMISLGDWIEVPEHNTNGIVIDITMTTVKVENLDKTVTQLPAYTLVTESFINWQNMINTGVRRMKRPLLIDAFGVCFLTGEMIEKLEKIPLLEEYLKENREKLTDLTNIGVFREYIYAYLRSRPDIRQDLTLVVRQLDPAGLGIPMEIIAFANETAAPKFEAIQSDIFDHLFAKIGEFGLRLFQRPSGTNPNLILEIPHHKPNCGGVWTAAD